MAIALDFASAYRATFFFLLFQEIILPPMDIQYRIVDLFSIGYSA